jgi:hypothetical protein
LPISELEGIAIPEVHHFQGSLPVLESGASFVALGDSGSGLPAQHRIAEQLMSRYKQHPFNLVLLLGDNIYPNGDTIKYGEKRFTTLYKPLIEQGVQFLPVLGNHDISGPLGVGYPTFWMSNQREHMRFFKMPAAFYDFTFGPIHFFMLNTNRFKSTQRLWLNEQLKASSHQYKIVCGHHPVFSSGFHGCNARLRRKLKPMMEKHGVSLYLSAHEHDFERLEAMGGVTYIVSGGGGANLRGFRKPLPQSLVRRSEHHFLACTLKSDHLQIEAINDQGEQIDCLELLLPQAQPVLV